jgi:Protein of unknown function (DUF4199)
MKKTVLTFGLISGAMMIVMMAATVPFAEKIDFDKGIVIGYTTMVAAFLMVFFGIRSYRENIGEGKISFGKAFAIGILITMITCLCYVAAWEVIYFKFMPDFADKYAQRVVEKAKATGATQQAIDAKVQEMRQFKEMYDKPLVNAAMTFTEPFPVGLGITLISSVILRRSHKKRGGQE